ncbi:hypothetical protein K4L06_03360 [Lysobacter sp. BMK333-48F3]|uniref:hypothetical protein n=1 Tax=Lysobacter sp. BMK333-48F3 TaxID=2867962 RepID=UPI001C8C47C8|nr:hypothetical protein [Lysobacter sp. BMK333-48F3]MBX9400334.1 hypothetical protein [Lysobacter sp. BMK333-48F3]
MSRFQRLQRRVAKREQLLQGRYEQAVERKDTLKARWREAWTPGRIVVAGVVAGFVMGRAEPVKLAAKSGNLMQLVTLLSGLFAGSSAQQAADQAGRAAGEAGQAADSAEAAVEAVVAPGYTAVASKPGKAHSSTTEQA